MDSGVCWIRTKKRKNGNGLLCIVLIATTVAPIVNHTSLPCSLGWMALRMTFLFVGSGENNLVHIRIP